MKISGEVNDAIVVQTCANIAADLIKSTGLKELDFVLEDFTKAFDHVASVVRQKIADNASPSTENAWATKRNIPIIPSQQEIQQGLIKVKQQPIVGAIEIAGKQHGAIPAWLPRAAAKAGVTKVFDNRDTATAENRRPQFVSADSNKTPFWAPKNITSEDVGLKFQG